MSFLGMGKPIREGRKARVAAPSLMNGGQKANKSDFQEYQPCVLVANFCCKQIGFCGKALQ